jgi:hypothetical protein
MHIRNRNFESATCERWVAPKIHVSISQLLLRNCISAFPQLTVEVQIKKNCDCGPSKLDFSNSATLNRIWIQRVGIRTRK